MSKSIHQVNYSDLFGQKKRPAPIILQVSSDRKVIIFSDCHLSHTFNKRVFDQLFMTINECDQLIINGDFWFDKKTTFDTFVRSRWSDLFPLMKKKNTIYLFGNHDMPRLSDERIFLFANEAGFELKLTVGNHIFHIEHGHLLSTGITKAVLTIFENHPRLLGYVTSPVGMVNERILNAKRNKHTYKISRTVNHQYKTKRLSKSLLSEYFVMGHTHVAEFDESRKYINLGRTHNGVFSYLSIYDNAIDLVVL